MVKKRLALASALLLAVLIVAVVVGGRDMGICDIKYELITPDGQTFDFWGVGRAPGSEATLQAHEGFGLPPVRHVTQDIYNVPGNLLVDVVVQGRTVTITESVYATDATRKGLHKALAEIWDAVRWDRGATRTMPSILRYTVDGNSWDLYVVLSGVVEGRQGRYGRNEIVGLRFEAHDPLWWDDEESLLTLDWEDESTVLYFASRVDGLWERDIAQPAAVTPGFGGPNIWAIAVDPETGDVIVAGNFTDWDNLGSPAGDYVVRWDVSAGAWTSIGGGLNDWVFTLCFGPDGVLYAGGAFLNGSGGAGDPLADGIAQYDALTDTWVNVGGGPGVGVALTNVQDIVVGYDGVLYVTGFFTAWGGLGSPAGDYIVQLPIPYAGGVWATVGNGLNSVGYALTVLPNGNIACGGNATIYGGVVCNYIGEWDGTTWAALGSGTNATVHTMDVHPNGDLYIGGLFTTASGTTVNRIARWNGMTWFDLDGGVSDNVNALSIAPDGMLYAGGVFITAGSLTLVDRVARWNGFTWARLDIDLPGILGVEVLVTYMNNFYLGFDTTGVTYYAGNNSVVTTGSAATLPVIEIKNQGLVRSIRNETTGQELLFDMQMLDGEIVTVDMSTGRKTVTSNWRGNRLGDLLPNSDLGTFKLESYPRAYYGGTVKGTNLVTAFITTIEPVEILDTNNELSGWVCITGINYNNTTLGNLYAEVVDAGAPPWRVDFFRDAARGIGDLVAHTANYAALGEQAIIADNQSGLGGYITIEALGPADATIHARYTVIRPRKFNDAAWQLTGFDGIIGIAQSNTNLGKLYVSVVDDGAGANWHVDLYEDFARTELVGHTASYAAAFTGLMAVVPDNASQLGGTITIAFPAAPVADVDIEVYFTIVTATWYNKWWSVDEAILAAE